MLELFCHRAGGGPRRGGPFEKNTTKFRGDFGVDISDISDTSDI